MSDHYDVIIIGTGAEAALARQAGGVGQAHPAARAWRLSAPRARELGLARGLPQRAVPLQRAMDRPGRPAVPAPPAVLRRRQHEVLRRDPVPASRARFQRGHPLRRRLLAWPISYSDLEPYYAAAEELYLVHGEAGEDPTEPPRSGPFPYPAVSHEPRIQELHDDLEKAGHRPFHLPVGVDLDESDPEAGRCVRCDRFDGFPPHRRQGRRARAVRAPGAQARQRHPADPRPRPATRDRRRGDERPRRRRPQGRRGGLQRRHRRRLLRGGELSRAAAALGVGPPPQRARELLRPRRAQLRPTSTRA